MSINYIKRIFVQANEFKEGDLAVGGTQDDLIRSVARHELSELKISEIVRHHFVEDELSEMLARSVDRKKLREIDHFTIGNLKNILLSNNAVAWIENYSKGLSSECIAAVVKIMSNDELSLVAKKLFNPLSTSNLNGIIEIGSQNHFGSRIQPNSPGDDEDEILMSTLEALCYGCGDVVIGLNPAGDELETIIRMEQLLQKIVKQLELPTRYCVLSDMKKQQQAAKFTTVDIGFQSLAGTSTALSGMLGSDVNELLEMCKSFSGLYFETGQGSEITNGAADGVDMVTLESRCYGLARHIQNSTGKWMIVNDVAGFIGPEVFKSGEQLKRACLEDVLMAKLHGITMGLDVCSTFHMGIHPVELEQLTLEITQLTSPAYLMAVAGKADPMLGYLTTSFRQHPRLRKHNSKQISSLMQQRLIDLGALTPEGNTDPTAKRLALLYAKFQKSGGDKRLMETIIQEGLKKINSLQERGCDIGFGSDTNVIDPEFVNKRLEVLFFNARQALYSRLTHSILTDCCNSPVHVSTISAHRDDYLANPSGGGKICNEHVILLQNLCQQLTNSPVIQFVISDGLNADAINENIRQVLPALKWNLKENGISVSPNDVIVTNGRVRAGYHIGQIVQPEILIHFIGERPGTGLNQMSVYLTYGFDIQGNLLFHSEMDHSLTTAVCGIHPQGKTPKEALDELMRLILKIRERRRSGVLLHN